MQVAAELGLTVETLGKWRRRHIQRGVVGPLDEPRSEAPRRLGADQIEAVVVTTLESTPRDASDLGTHAMAQASGLSDTTVPLRGVGGSALRSVSIEPLG